MRYRNWPFIYLLTLLTYELCLKRLVQYFDQLRQQSRTAQGRAAQLWMANRALCRCSMPQVTRHSSHGWFRILQYVQNSENSHILKLQLNIGWNVEYVATMTYVGTRYTAWSWICIDWTKRLKSNWTRSTLTASAWHLARRCCRSTQSPAPMSTNSWSASLACANKCFHTEQQ